MSQMIDLYFKRDTLEKLVQVLKQKEAREAGTGKGVSITVSVNDEVGHYGQNVSAIVAQSKEQREAKKDRFYVANGKTFWSNKGDFIPTKETAPTTPTETAPAADETDLPF